MSGTVQKYQADLLIVDDVPDNIRFLSSFLVQKNYQVRKAINGQMALSTVQVLAPDLILLDVNLPDMSGYEVCRYLKADPRTDSIPVIFLSAGDATIDKVKAFQTGAVDYITKPFHLEEALVRIQTQLTIQDLQKELQAQNEQLKQALNELKTAQVNLVQQERMATLRKVVAGVAHEINNPLSFIAGNLGPAQEYINHLLNIVKLYQQEGKEADFAVKAYLEEIDLEFIASDLLNIISSMKHGAKRIHAVMLALRIFTRLDEVGIKAIDLHENINNVLVLLQQRLTSRADGVTIQVRNRVWRIASYCLLCRSDQPGDFQSAL
jgi:DNA-binding response OmpR family regulator